MDIIRPQSSQSMPEDAKCVFKGKIFSVYQWEVEGYDGSKHTFEKVKRPDTVIVIAVLDNGKILMTKEDQPGKDTFYSLPGGRIDEGEEVLEAAKRELLEETGYVAKDWSLFHSLQPTSKVEWALFYLIARGCSKESEQDLDGAEKVEAFEVTWEEFIEKALSPEFNDGQLKMLVLEALRGEQGVSKLKSQILKV